MSLYLYQTLVLDASAFLYHLLLLISLVWFHLCLSEQLQDWASLEDLWCGLDWYLEILLSYCGVFLGVWSRESLSGLS